MAKLQTVECLLTKFPLSQLSIRTTFFRNTSLLGSCFKLMSEMEEIIIYVDWAFVTEAVLSELPNPRSFPLFANHLGTTPPTSGTRPKTAMTYLRFQFDRPILGLWKRPILSETQSCGSPTASIAANSLRNCAGRMASYSARAANPRRLPIFPSSEYVNGNVHTNTMENFWSLLKRGLHGTYIICSVISTNRRSL